MNTLPFWEVCLRLGLAMLCGGVIGVERGRKHRPAGFRTYILVCVGAALTMVLSAYMVAMYATWEAALGIELTKGDFSRLGAQVINGIGFLGAGTIIVTGKNQVKGMTTAAGLWASAIVGLCTGAGFIEGALITTFIIVVAELFLSRFEYFMISNSRTINILVEFNNTTNLTLIIDTVKESSSYVRDIEITRSNNTASNSCAIFSLQMPRKTSHAKLLNSIASLDGVVAVEEL